MSLNQLTLKKSIEFLEEKQISLKEIYQDIYLAIKKKNQQLNVYLYVNEKGLEQGEKLIDLPLKGLPIAVKDNFLTVGMPTTASSKVLENYYPQYESTVTKRLKENGGVIIGKTNMDAWAHGSSTETSDFGTTKNPRNSEYSPGGSSGGSAAAIAGDLAIAALGTETAGSIRQPASWCGVVGLKPTYGRVSRYGVIAMGSSLDSPGPITKTVEDAAILLSYIAGYDKNDATTSSKPLKNYLDTLKKPIKDFKIGVCYFDIPELKDSQVNKALEKVVEVLKNLGAQVNYLLTSNNLEEDKVLSPKYAIGVYTVVQRGEVSSNLARYDEIRYGQGRKFFGAEAKRRIMLGIFGLSKNLEKKELVYQRAQRVRNLYIKNFKQLFSKYDVLISATSPSFALPIGSSASSPMFGELQDMLAEPSSLAGICGISVPMFKDKKTNLYLGLNIMGNYFQEEKILQVAYNYEQATEWNSWKNKI